ncbi:unnamed protein product [Amoebophrya sp. A120]|nr:unnamed protein product [Amoebophrya sp. A120]|eukprot:GSA120T00002994001.1
MQDLTKARGRLQKERAALLELTLEEHGLCTTLEDCPIDGTFPAKWRAYVQGPLSTCWEAGVFAVEMEICAEFPTKPSKVRFTDPVFHPNVGPGGEICDKLFQEMWSPVIRLEKVLLTVRSLLVDEVRQSPGLEATDEATRASGTMIKTKILTGTSSSSSALASSSGSGQHNKVYSAPRTAYQLQNHESFVAADGRTLPRKLYHYTSGKNRDRIQQSGVLMGSSKGGYGPGVYATAIHPMRTTEKTDILANNYGFICSGDGRADFVIELDVQCLLADKYNVQHHQKGTRDIYLLTLPHKSQHDITLTPQNHHLVPFHALASCEVNHPASELIRSDNALYRACVQWSIVNHGTYLEDLPRQGGVPLPKPSVMRKYFEKPLPSTNKSGVEVENTPTPARAQPSREQLKAVGEAMFSARSLVPSFFDLYSFPQFRKKLGEREGQVAEAILRKHLGKARRLDTLEFSVENFVTKKRSKLRFRNLDELENHGAKYFVEDEANYASSGAQDELQWRTLKVELNEKLEKLIVDKLSVGVGIGPEEIARTATAVSVRAGVQPEGALSWNTALCSCTGYENFNTLQVEFSFNAGQDADGRAYARREETCYLPRNPMGLCLLHLFQVAFKKGVMSKLGHRESNKQYSPCFHVRIKTWNQPGAYGWPDPSYWTTTIKKLAGEGITFADVDFSVQQKAFVEFFKAIPPGPGESACWALLQDQNHRTGNHVTASGARRSSHGPTYASSYVFPHVRGFSAYQPPFQAPSNRSHQNSSDPLAPSAAGVVAGTGNWTLGARALAATGLANLAVAPSAGAAAPSSSSLAATASSSAAVASFAGAKAPSSSFLAATPASSSAAVLVLPTTVAAMWWEGHYRRDDCFPGVEIHQNFEKHGYIPASDLLQRDSTGHVDVQLLGHEVPNPLPNACSVCLDEEDPDPTARSGVCLSNYCSHTFHKSCLSGWFKNGKKECPQCRAQLCTLNIGKMPDGNMSWSSILGTLAGTEPTTHMLQVTFDFPAGFSVEEQKAYHGRSENAFLPINKEGTTLLELFKIAFKRRLMFGLGDRLTGGRFGPTFNIHLKTTVKQVGAHGHGYPDPGYFQRTIEELKTNGIEIKDIQVQNHSGASPKLKKQKTT